MFADGTSGTNQYRGFIDYDHNTDTLNLGSGGGTRVELDGTGAMRNTFQPAFNAYLSATQSNVALNSNVTLQFDTERFDQNADFNTSNYTFTAPVTGKYQINVTVYIMAVDTAADYYYINLLTSNENYYATLDPGGFSTDISYLPFQISQLVDMDASDTASVRILQQGTSTQQTDINNNSFFSGYLVA